MIHDQLHHSRAERSLDPRLRAVCALVPPGSRVADVGTDHAGLPRALLATGRATACIATERTSTRLQPAENMRSDSLLPRSLDLRAGDGLAPLRPSDRIEVLVLAGLGGRSICRILRGDDLGRLAVRRVVAQPQTEVGRVRRHLVALDLRIAEERLVRQSDRFYFVIAAERSGRAAIDPHPSLDVDDLLEAGPCLVRDAAPGLVEYWARQRTRCESIVRRATTGRSAERARRHMERAGRILRALGSPPEDRRTPGGGVL